MIGHSIQAGGLPDEPLQPSVCGQHTGPSLVEMVADQIDYSALHIERSIFQPRVASPRPWSILTRPAVGNWAALVGLDPATPIFPSDAWAIPLAHLKGKPECISDDCPYRETCSPSVSARCVLTNCGDGVCPGCPKLFDLNNLVVKGWCSYTCTTKGEIVAIKVRVRLKMFGSLSKCVPFEKPVPCEGECM